MIQNNRFSVTGAEMTITTIFLVLLSVSNNVRDVASDKTLIYEDMGCKAIDVESVTGYNCDHVFENQCSYKDTVLKPGQAVPQSVSLLSCSSSCRCKQNGFVCSLLRCPEQGLVTLSKGDCYHVYTLNECCNRGEICPPLQNVPTCKVDGKTYFKGQKFFPNNTDLHCICQEQFKGEYVTPFCRKVECGIQLKFGKQLKNRCAPMFEPDDETNCPSSWICPEEGTDDVIVATSNQDKPLKCSYGEVRLNVGAYFERKKLDYLFQRDKIIRCECTVPPLLTCTVSRTIPW